MNESSQQPKPEQMLLDRMSQLLNRSHKEREIESYRRDPSLISPKQKELDKQIPVPSSDNPQPSLLEKIREKLGLPADEYLHPDNDPKTK